VAPSGFVYNGEFTTAPSGECKWGKTTRLYIGGHYKLRLSCAG